MEASLAAALSSAIPSMSSARTLQQLQRVGASEDQLNKMSDKFKFIQNYVEDVHVQIQELSTQAAVRRWLKKVNELTFFVENTIDEYEYEILQTNNINNKTLKKNKPFFSLPCRNGYNNKVSKIISLLNNLEREFEEMGISDDAITTSHRYQRSDSASFDQVPDNMFVGRDSDKDTIVDTLCNANNTGGGLFTVAIVGMTGIGKTALAKRVCDHRRINGHFERFFVKVGEVFDATGILSDMYHNLPKEMGDMNDSETVRMSKLKDAVKGKKVLIVLDDVRSVDQEQLSRLDRLHTVEAAEICILATTRRLEAARTLGASYTHLLQGLSDEDSRKLFDIVYLSKTPQVEVSDQRIYGILDKCYGVPRVIWKIADSLQERADVSKWKIMAETELCDLTSFNSLPKAVRQCFVYCSIFPKGAVIKKSDLIRLWLAQGFLSEEATGHNVDIKTETAIGIATGEKFFDILLNESLLLVSKQDEYGNAIDCTLHDFVHDLAMKYSRHDLLIIDDQEQQPSNLSDVRHLVISSSNERGAPKVKAPSKLRTLYSMVSVPEKFLSQAQSLHVLKLDGIGLEEVPKNLGKLKFLRYLDLSNNPFSYLPESITQLFLLQTLLLVKCENLSELPKDLLSLPNLKIDVDTAQRSSLVELDESQGSIKLSELGSLTDLDYLCIKGLEHVRSKEATREASIGMKEGLSALELYWNREVGDNQNCSDEDVLDGLQPHPNIERLKLANYDSKKFPSWMNMKVEDNRLHYKLVKIELLDCKRCLQLPTLGQLPCLQVLIIAGMDSIKEIGPEFYDHCDGSGDNDVLKVFFSALTRLELRNCVSLEVWHPASTCNATSEAFSSLETLHISKCPNLKSIPTKFPSMKSLLVHEVKKNDWLDNIIRESSKNHSIISLVLSMVYELQRLPNELFNCKSLQQLRLHDCKDLNSWPSGSWNLESLKELCIDNCCRLTFPPLINGTLTALNTLIIRGCCRLITFPIDFAVCKSLAQLSVANCDKLEAVPNLKELTRLEELDIIECGKLGSLKHLGLEDLTSLRTMRVYGVHNMSENFPQCTSLEKLCLKGTNDMIYLPSQLRHLSQLKVLRIMNFDSLKIVPDWICELRSLQRLIFENCGQLRQLPSRKHLLQLRSLIFLQIEECAILGDTYDEGNSQEWSSISHVLHIKIKGRWLKGDRLQAQPSESDLATEEAIRPLPNDDNNFGFEWTPDNGDPGSTSFYFCLLLACVLILLIFRVTSPILWSIMFHLFSKCISIFLV